MKHEPNDLIARTHTLKWSNIKNLEEEARQTHRGNKSECLDDILTARYAKKTETNEPDSQT